MVWWGCMMVNQLTVSPWSQDTDRLSTLPHGVVYDGEPTQCVSLESRHYPPVNTPLWCVEGAWWWTNSLCLSGVKTLTPCQHSLMVWWERMMVNQLTVSPWSQDTDPLSTLPHGVVRVYDGESTHCVSLVSRHWPLSTLPHGVVRVYDGEPTHCVTLESRHWPPVNTPSWCVEGAWWWTNSLCLPVHLRLIGKLAVDFLIFLIGVMPCVMAKA